MAIIKVYISPSVRSIGYTRDEIVAEVMIGFNVVLAKAANVTGRLVSRASDAHVQVYAGELYMGNGMHARGMFKPATPKAIYLHNGRVAPYHHSGTHKDYTGKVVPKNQWLYYQILGDGTIPRIAVHEFMHMLGLGHSNDTKCIMHPKGSSGWLCASETRWAQSRWGKPVARAASFMSMKMPPAAIEVVL